MAGKAAVDKIYRTFIAGFITEATGLTFPENSCHDIDNCDIELKGSVRRRLGLNEEPGGFTVADGYVSDTTFPSGVNSGPYSVVLSAPVTVPAANLAVTVHTWSNPGGQEGVYLIVIQIGNSLFFRNWDGVAVSDPNQLTGICTTTQLKIDESTATAVPGFVYKTTPDICAQTPLQSSSGFGRLWFASAAVFPFYLDYDATTLSVTANYVGYDKTNPTYQYGRLDVRDFNGVPDGLGISDQPVTLTREHMYNLVNQGWNFPDPQAGHDTIEAVQSARGTYPSNAEQWILGLNQTNDFDPSWLAKTSFGNTQAPTGHNIINALSGSKDNLVHSGNEYESPINFHGQYDEASSTGFSTVAFYAGRVWLAGDTNSKRTNGVYFSKVLQKIEDSGVMMQVGDPTAQNNSDLLATDGGVIYITEADRIEKIIAYGAGVLVMAHNGVWMITGDGTGGGFTATTFSIQKIGSTGIIGPQTVAATDQAMFYFGENGVQAVTLPQQGVIPIITDISRSKIFTFYNAINRNARQQSKAIFDEISKKVFWFYLDAPTYAYPLFQSCYNKCLILDTRTGAFTKYSFNTVETNDTGLFSIVGGFTNRYPATPFQQDEVVLSDGTEVIVTSGDEVVVFEAPLATEEFINNIHVVMIDRSTADGCARICEFYDLSFLDFLTMGTHTTDYSSYVEAGDEILGDVQRNKQATYLHSYFLRTETGFDIDSSGKLEAVRPSGCTVSGHWDWQDTATGHRWSRPQAAYRYRRPYAPTGTDDTYDTGEGIVYTKLKMRGQGKALTVQYNSVTGRDFQLQGFSVAFTANAV